MQFYMHNIGSRIDGTFDSLRQGNFSEAIGLMFGSKMRPTFYGKISNNSTKKVPKDFFIQMDCKANLTHVLYCNIRSKKQTEMNFR